MKRRIVVWTAIPLALLIIVVTYITLDKALYLEWSEYKIPEYPVGGSDNEVIYKFDSQTILASLEKSQENIFTPAPTGFESISTIWPYGSFAWNQEDHFKIANAIHQLVWGETLENWLVYNATFYIFKYPFPGGIEYSHFVFYTHQNNEYTVHAITIKPLYDQVIIGQAVYHDKNNWRGFDLQNLAVKNVDSAILIAEQNGASGLCPVDANQCEIGFWLTPSLDEDRNFLIFPIYRYEWKWGVTYYDMSQHRIFDIDIDPYTGGHEIIDHSP